LSSFPAPSPQQTIRPHLVFRDTARALEFYAKAFGAVETYRLVEPGGKVGHAEMVIGDSTLQLADEYPDFGALSPATIGGSPVKFLLYVDDADAAQKRAIEAGATELRPVQDQFYGDRSGMVADPFGYSWSIAQRKEEVSPEEMQERFTAMLGGAG
jgi:PhnB protein